MEIQEKDLKEFNGKLLDLDDKLENYTITLNKKINQASGGNLDDILNNIDYLQSSTSNLSQSFNEFKTEANNTLTTHSTDILNLQNQQKSTDRVLNYTCEYVAEINDQVQTTKQTVDILSTTTTTIQNNISLLEMDNETNKTNILSLQNANTDIITNIENLQNDNQINKTNIELLQNDMINAQQDILDLQNGSGGSGGDTTELTEKVDRIENITNRFISLIKDRNAATNPDYTEIDPETTVQTYDYADRLYDFTGTGDFHSAEFYFSVPTDCTAHIKIITHINSETEGQGKFKLYFNGDTLTDTITFNYDTSTTFVEFDFDKTVLASGNMLYFKLSADTSIHFTYAKVEVSQCSNPVMLIKPKKFDVIYALGKYHLADCSSGILKLASINVDDIASIDDIQWEDTGIDARECAFTLESEDTAYPYTVKTIHYAVIHKNNNITFYDNNRNIVKPIISATAAKISYCFCKSKYIYYYATVIYSNSHKKLDYYSSDGSTYYMDFKDSTLNSTYYLAPKRNTYDLIIDNSRTCYCAQYSNGDIKLVHSSKNLILGKGQLLEFYSFGNSSALNYVVIAKIFNDVVKFKINNNASGNLTLESSEVLGYYDHFFLGANNDYFVVKNNKLYYYKDYLQDLDNDETTA